MHTSINVPLERRLDPFAPDGGLWNRPLPIFNSETFFQKRINIELLSIPVNGRGTSGTQLWVSLGSERKEVGCYDSIVGEISDGENEICYLMKLGLVIDTQNPPSAPLSKEPSIYG
ncbi:MAG: hypothetical protein CL920_24415 [Deltaproteobacteria bacterium]|nr:hypothetical protein [Deltaproteobacteria bacterium]|tara:strand:- start:4746 stop:5093 length:348 start_codon:yes stop_codon:yes gene_type:complete